MSVLVPTETCVQYPNAVVYFEIALTGLGKLRNATKIRKEGRREGRKCACC